MTAAELIATRQCTARCLLASSRRYRCNCYCAGRYHQLLIGADLSALIDGRGRGMARMSDIEVLMSA